MPLAYLPPLPPSPTTIECVAISLVLRYLYRLSLHLLNLPMLLVLVFIAPTVIRVLLPAAPYGQPPPPPKTINPFHTDGELFR